MLKKSAGTGRGLWDNSEEGLSRQDAMRFCSSFRRMPEAILTLPFRPFQTHIPHVVSVVSLVQVAVRLRGRPTHMCSLSGSWHAGRSRGAGSDREGSRFRPGRKEPPPADQTRLMKAFSPTPCGECFLPFHHAPVTLVRREVSSPLIGSGARNPPPSGASFPARMSVDLMADAPVPGAGIEKNAFRRKFSR